MNLLLLQNKLKRDPSSYQQDFDTQFIHFKALLEIFKLNLLQENEDLQQSAMFLSHCSPMYKNCDFQPILMEFMFLNYLKMAPITRLKLVQSLLFLFKQLDLRIVELTFLLLELPDKILRDLIKNFLVQKLKRETKLKLKVQSMILKNLNYRKMQIVIELYQKNCWIDSKTVTIIADGINSQDLKLMKLSCLFFLGKLSSNNEDEEQEDDDLTQISFKNQVNRKTKSRSGQYEKALLKIKKKERQRNKVENFNFSALHLINDPQEFAERLLSKLRQLTIKNLMPFESRLLFMDLISRLIGKYY